MFVASAEFPWLDKMIEAVNSSDPLTDYSNCLLEKTECTPDIKTLKGRKKTLKKRLPIWFF